MKISIGILKFLFIGALFIVSNQNLALNVDENRGLFYESYYSWMSTLLSHSLQIAGYVVNSGWLPGENQTGPLESVSV